MPGSMRSKLADTNILLSGCAEVDLDWNQRLQIALCAAQGLEYLHYGCKPAIIHRDVKSANILLNDKLVAKIADFGLSKTEMPDDYTHVSTAVAGTAGYLDPEYSTSCWLNEKSDVYSFGVVLLELICGRLHVIEESSGQRIHIVEWVRENLLRGSHENVVDTSLAGKYDISSFWKVANMAIECTADKRIKRPNMNNVVIKLKEAIADCNTVSSSEDPGTVAQPESEACAFHYNSCTTNEEITISAPR